LIDDLLSDKTEGTVILCFALNTLRKYVTQKSIKIDDFLIKRLK
jgi:hypothetical protein